MPERSIIHLNVADFAVAVERAIDCRLRRRPVIVAPLQAARALVYDMSDEAYGAGVRKGMALGRAGRLCREAVLLEPRPERYGRAMQAILKRVLPYSPLVEEAFGDGHLFADVTGTHRLFGPPPDIAWRIRRSVFAELALEPIWSVAPNKLVAKVASRLVKPRGEYIVAAGEEAAFLRPLPIRLLPGISGAEHGLLREFNLARVGELAALSMAQLSVLFGRRGLFLYDTARGIDPSPVLPAGDRQPRIVAAYRFSEDTNDVEQVRSVLQELVEQCGAGLRVQGLAARRVAVFLEYADGRRTVRQATATRAAANDFDLLDLAVYAWQRAWTRRVRLRRLHLVCDRFGPPPAQLELFAGPRAAREKRDGISVAMDTIRQRFGRQSIRRGGGRKTEDRNITNRRMGDGANRRNC